MKSISFEQNSSKTRFFPCPEASGNKQNFIELFPPLDFLAEFPLDAHVAITGNDDWQVGGGGINGDFAKYLSDLNSSSENIDKVNEYLKKSDSYRVSEFLKESNSATQVVGRRKRMVRPATNKLKNHQELSNLGFKNFYNIGALTVLNLEHILPSASSWLPAKYFIYSSSPNLNELEGENLKLDSAKAAMKAFGNQFRSNLHEAGIKKVVMPLFSGGFFAGIFKEKNLPDLAEATISGFLEADESMRSQGVAQDLEVYFANNLLFDAVQKQVSSNVDPAPKLAYLKLEGASFVNRQLKISRSQNFQEAPANTFYRPEPKIVANKEIADFDISVSNDSKVNLPELDQEILNNLKDAMCEEGKKILNNEQAAAVILIAIKHGGIGNIGQNILKEELNKAFADKGCDIDQLAKDAKKFSRNYQKITESCGIFTGNQSATNLVGMRLKRLTPNFALQVASAETSEIGLENQKEIFSQLCEKILTRQTGAESPKASFVKVFCEKLNAPRSDRKVLIE